ncbi:MAG: efflux transporter outer membrane subunit [Gammaproteobacteria bacterium]
MKTQRSRFVATRTQLKLSPAPPVGRVAPKFDAVVTTFGLLLVVMLAGCTKLGPDFVKPDAPVAGDWIESHPRLKREATELHTWWKVFNDPVLDERIDAAHGQNLPLQIAGLRIIEARAELGIAVGQLYPQAQQARGGLVFERLSESQVNTAGADINAWTYDAGFDAVWELDFWGRFRRGIESADASFFASVAYYEDVLVSLTAEAASAYVAVRTFGERIELAEQNVEIQRQGLELAEIRFQNGAITELDVQQARALLNNTRATIPRLKTGLRQAMNALGILLGQPPGQVSSILDRPGAIPVAPSEVAVGIPAELLRRRPDVRRAELQAAAQSALVGVAMTDLYPSFTLTGSIGFAASDGTRTTSSGNSGFDELFDMDSLAVFGGPSFTWNIFNYGRLKNNVRVQDARSQQLLVNYQDTVLRAAQEVEDAMVGFLRSQEQVSFLTDSVDAADRAVDISLIQYRDGAVDYQRVLDSQNTLVAQQDLWTETRGDVARNLIAMYKALGGGWQVHAGKPIVAQHIREEMRSRTDWGGLLDPAALDVPPPEEAGEKLRRVDW